MIKIWICVLISWTYIAYITHSAAQVPVAELVTLLEAIDKTTCSILWSHKRLYTTFFCSIANEPNSTSLQGGLLYFVFQKWHWNFNKLWCREHVWNFMTVSRRVVMSLGWQQSVHRETDRHINTGQITSNSGVVSATIPTVTRDTLCHDTQTDSQSKNITSRRRRDWQLNINVVLWLLKCKTLLYVSLVWFWSRVWFQHHIFSSLQLFWFTPVLVLE